MLEPDWEHGKVPEHDQDVQPGRGGVSDGDPMGQYAVLFAGSAEAVLRLETVRHEGCVREDPPEVHALLHAHLVRGLGLLGVLPRGTVQLLCDCEYSVLSIGIFLESLPEYFWNVFQNPYRKSSRTTRECLTDSFWNFFENSSEKSSKIHLEKLPKFFRKVLNNLSVKCSTLLKIMKFTLDVILVMTE